MPDIQLKTYIDTIDRFKNSINKKYIFEIIAKLRDISLHPYLYKSYHSLLEETNDQEFIEASARFKILFKVIDEIKKKDEKLVIFLESKKLQAILRRILFNKYGISCFIINGETKPSLRKNHIDNFQRAYGFNIIILSPLAAGVGLTVTAANHVIHLNRLWNPAKEDQATDRVYRIGQKKDVFVYIPIGIHKKLNTEEYQGSFDEKLNRLLERKRELSKTVLAPSFLTIGDFEKFVGTTIHHPSTEDEAHIDINYIDELSPEQFEQVIGELYRKIGYKNVVITPLVGDKGVDIVVMDKEKGNFLIQCKHVSKNKLSNLPPAAVREIVSARLWYENFYKCSFNLIALTNAKNFTRTAEELAESNNVELINREKLKKLLKENKLSSTADQSFFL